MPPTVIIALVLLALNVGFHVLNLVTGDGNIIGMIIAIALLAGLLKGSEGTRSIIMVLCGIGIVFGLIGLLMGVGGSLVTIALVFGIVTNGVVIWCMNDQRTRTWMAHRSLGIES